VANVGTKTVGPQIQDAANGKRNVFVSEDLGNSCSRNEKSLDISFFLTVAYVILFPFFDVSLRGYDDGQKVSESVTHFWISGYVKQALRDSRFFAPVLCVRNAMQSISEAFGGTGPWRQKNPGWPQPSGER
jgi:hypothetical protein